MLETDKVLPAILRGAMNANRNYEEWTDGLWVTDHGIEPVISYEVAGALFKAGKRAGKPSIWITLETTFEDILEYSGAAKKPGRPPSELRDGAKADVVVWNGRNNTIGVVEVKRKFNYSIMENDLRRIDRLISYYGREHDGTVRWGAVVGVGLAFEGARRTPEDRLAEFIGRCIRDFPRRHFLWRHQLTRIKPEKQENRIIIGFDSFGVLMRAKRETCAN